MIREQDFLSALQALASATRLEAVTPDDDTTLDFNVRCLYVGTGGTVVVSTSQSTEVPFKCPDGFYLFVNPTKVHEASTATDIVAMGD
jgi:hypothetical protein